jgi:hypothetical protein
MRVVRVNVHGQDGGLSPRPAMVFVETPRSVNVAPSPALAMFHLFYTVWVGIPLGLTFFALGHQVLELR